MGLRFLCSAKSVDTNTISYPPIEPSKHITASVVHLQVCAQVVYIFYNWLEKWNLPISSKECEQTGLNEILKNNFAAGSGHTLPEHKLNRFLQSVMPPCASTPKPHKKIYTASQTLLVLTFTSLYLLFVLTRIIYPIKSS